MVDIQTSEVDAELETFSLVSTQNCLPFNAQSLIKELV
jgi:hypothetical protein